MDIPVKEYKIKDGAKNIPIKVKSWLTQEEDDEYMSLMVGKGNVAGESAINDAQANIDKDFKLRLDTDVQTMFEGQRFLLKKYLIEPTYEEFNVMNPSLREQIVDIIDNHHNKKK